MQFIARVELRGHPEIADYVKLHATAASISFLREITSDDGQKYKTPNGTYASSGFFNTHTAHATFLNAMVSAGLRGEILVMGSDGAIVWSGLDLIPAPASFSSVLGAFQSYGTPSTPATPTLGLGLFAGFGLPNDGRS